MEKKHESDNCLLQDGSIFIGLTSLPIGKEEDTNKIVDKIFQKFSKRLEEKIEDYSNTKKEDTYLENLNEFFYKPKMFYLFGKFDLASITLIDGFSFPVREFSLKGFHLFSEKKSTLDISRHTILGPTPKFKKEDITKHYDKLYNNNSLSLISITRLKLNDTLLFGHGTKFIRGCIKHINHFLKNEIKKGLNFDFIIMESYGWSEITILFFIDSYKTIGEIMIQLRNFNLLQLLKTLDKIDKPLRNKFSQTEDDFNTILLKFQQNKDNNEDLSAQLFIDSHSIYGFDYDLFKENQLVNSHIKENIPVMHKIEVSANPGYITDTFKKLIKKNIETKPNEKVQAVVGKSDILYYIDNEQQIDTRKLIQWVIDFRKPEGDISQINNLSTSIMLEHDMENFPELDLNNASPILSDSEIVKFKFDSDTLRELNRSLGILNIPHVIKEAILNLFSIFNNKISAPLSFASFLELRPFLTYLLRVIAYETNDSHSSREYSPKTLLKKLDKGIHAFHYAYYNRVLGQYKNGDQYDQPMFFNIGSQSLISAFDILYKNITTIIGNQTSFVYVESDPQFTISDFALRLNYFHLFNPEILCSVLFQEAMNQCQSRFMLTHPDLFKFHRTSDFDNNTQLIDWHLLKNGLETELLREEYKTLIEPLTPEFFEHIFSDLVGYKLFYQNDPQLFTYWSWGHFSTDVNHFFKNEKDGLEVIPMYLIPYMFRQLIVLKVFEEKEYENFEMNIDPKLNKVVNDNLTMVKTFLDSYFCKGDLLIWLDRIKKFADDLLDTIQDGINQEQNALSIKKIIEKLNSGRVIDYQYDEENDYKTFMKTRNLLYAYLKSVEIVCEERKSFNILYRKEMKQDHLDKNEYSNLLFDPQGGTYIVKPKIRRDMYRLRSTFHMSLINMSLLKKGQMRKKMMSPERDSIADITFNDDDYTTRDIPN